MPETENSLINEISEEETTESEGENEEEETEETANEENSNESSEETETSSNTTETETTVESSTSTVRAVLRSSNSYVAKIGDTYYTDLASAVSDAVASTDNEVTITITSDITLTSTLTISADSSKTITFTTDGPYTITTNSSLGSLISVTNGATVIFEGGSSTNTLTLDGNSKTNMKVLNITNGTVKLKNNAIVTGGYLHGAGSWYSYGVIYVYSTSAKFVLDGGEVSNNVVDMGYGIGTITAYLGEIEINSGKICYNKINGNAGYYYTAGLMLAGATCTINGGTISYNTMTNPSLSTYPTYAFSAMFAFESIVTINDCTIEYNTQDVTSNNDQTSLGTVGVMNSDFTLNDGTFSHNGGENFQYGGAITVLNYSSSWQFIMNGGTISNNVATHGGGVYTYGQNSIIKAGNIIDNKATDNGGGVYVEGLCTMYNVFVSENTADIGGGIWCCPTGDVSIYVNNGGMITENDADEAGDDLAFTVNANSGVDNGLIFTDRAFNGAKVNWYKDGATNDESLYGKVAVDSAERYDDASNPEEVTTYESTSSISLHSEVESEAYEMAESTAKLVITGNTASWGGGIGTNGAVVIGENKTTTDVTVKKVWDHADNDESNYPDSITLQLLVTTEKLSGSSVIQTITLTESEMSKNNYTYTFENLPIEDPNGDAYIYSIKETAIEGYTASISDIDENNIIKITNTYGIIEEEDPNEDDPEENDPEEDDPAEEDPEENNTEEDDPEEENNNEETNEDNTAETSESDNETSEEQEEESGIINYISNVVKTGDQISMFIIIAVVALIALMLIRSRAKVTKGKNSRKRNASRRNGRH